MIGPISRERFDKRFPGGIPNPEISLRRWFENSADKTLGFIAFHQDHQSWAAGVLKKRHGQYQVWRQAAGLESEREAVDVLFRLFGLTDLGYRELLAEKEFCGKPEDQMEFLIHSRWKFDPAYDQATRDQLDAPLEAYSRKYFTQFYPVLRAQLEAEPGQKSACSVQAFITPCEALGAPVLGMVGLIIGSDFQPYELTVFVGREEFITEERERIVKHLREVAARPGMRMIGLEEFQP